MTVEDDTRRPWYRGITRYQWTVLLIASLGWVFDIFEGQIFVTSMNEAMPSLLPSDASDGTAKYYNNIALGAFLLGGAFGGILFGMLSDRIGRTRTMILTILTYSLFTCVTALAQSPWQMIVLRFFVAMGVGGEWAVASAMISEVFSREARARMLGIFHSTSVAGSLLAAAAGALIVGNADLKTEAYPDLNWRLGFLIGALPALLTIWIRLRLREPERWVQAQEAAKQDTSKQPGRLADLFASDLRRRTFVGVSLAAVGLSTFWGVRIYGKDLMRATIEAPYAAALPAALTERGKPKQAVLNGDVDAVLELLPSDNSVDQKLAILGQALESRGPAEPVFARGNSEEQKRAALKARFDQMFEAIKDAEMIGFSLVILGGLIGMLSFGPLCERIGRRGAFLFFQLGGFAISLTLFKAMQAPSATALWFALPVFGALTGGMHAGFAIYFPELFPTRLRGTGGGFCFNAGRLIAVPVLFVGGWMQKDWGFSLEDTVAILSFLFLAGVLALIVAPETKGRELPE